MHLPRTRPAWLQNPCFLQTTFSLPIRGQLLLGWEKGREERREEAGVSVQAGEDTGPG